MTQTASIQSTKTEVLDHIAKERKNGTSLTAFYLAIFTKYAEDIQEKMAKIASETFQWQENDIPFMNDVIGELTASLTNEKEMWKLTPEMKEKFEKLKEFGIKIPGEGKTQLSALERDLLIKNINLKVTEMTQKIQTRTQKMEMLNNAYQQAITILREIQKTEAGCIKKMNEGIR